MLDAAGGGECGRVLIVDDEVFIARAVGCILADRRGAQVEVARDGDQALAVARTLRPHLILVDVRMPGLPPLELCRRLREMPGLGATAIYLLTGVLPADEEVGPLLEVARGIINKPPDPGEVMAALDEAMRASGVAEPVGAASAGRLP
jgi:two-component system, OmpR family, alkaline phosphatase synthesis response regulator PhoP